VDGTYGDEFRPWTLASFQGGEGLDSRMREITWTYVVGSLDRRGTQRMKMGWTQIHDYNPHSPAHQHLIITLIKRGHTRSYPLGLPECGYSP